MKRDIDLVRGLLIELEGEDPFDLTPYSDDQIKYHKALLIEAKFAEGFLTYSSTGEKPDIPAAINLKKLTWEGHEFLDKARDNNVWNKAKSLVKTHGTTLSIEAMKLALSEVLKNLFT